MQSMLPLPKEQIKGDLSADIVYLDGRPRQYIFDASKGHIKMKDQTPLTKPGESFSLTPIGYRIFKDAILGMKEMTWFEVYFLNTKLQVCSMLFHGYSVDELHKTVIEDLYYDKIKLTDVTLMVTPSEKRKKDTGEKYFIATFGKTPLNTKQLETIQKATHGLDLWREDTITLAEPSFQMSSNYAKERAMNKNLEIHKSLQAHEMEV